MMGSQHSYTTRRLRRFGRSWSKLTALHVSSRRIFTAVGVGYMVLGRLAWRFSFLAGPMESDLFVWRSRHDDDT